MCRNDLIGLESTPYLWHDTCHASFTQAMPAKGQPMEEGMDIGSGPAIISAGSGILGALVGGLIVVGKEMYFNKKKREKETVYLAAIVSSHLERFANSCSNVAFDDGTEYGRPSAENGEYKPTTTPPEFQPLDIEVEWKVLPNDLIYSILQIPDQQAQVQNRHTGIADFAYDPPFHTEYFWTRRRDYADLGLQASDLARRLRSHAKIPMKAPKLGERSRDQGLREIIEKIDSERESHERRLTKSLERLQDASKPI